MSFPALSSRFPTRRSALRIGGLSVAIALLMGVGGIYHQVDARRAFDVVLPGNPEPIHTATRLAKVHRADARPAIAMIGDSWISKSKFDQPVREALAALGFGDLVVRGIGQGGATSRTILRNLLASPSEPHSGSALLSDEDVRYCVVIAGVNDSAQHLGADFYAHHVIQISRVLLARGITPILLELPEYGIEAIRANRSGLRLAKDMLFAELFDGGDVDVIEDYRLALREAILDAELEDDVELVSFDAIATDYDASIDLYRDPAHLNDAGRALLAAHVAARLTARIERDRTIAVPTETLRIAGF